MGCDIHAHVEVKIDDKWEHYSALCIPRDYSLFQKIAGVRGDKFKPVIEPRGLPPSLSFITQYELETHWDGDAHTPGWLTGEEANEVEEWFDRHRKADNYPSQPWGYVFGSSFAHFSSQEDSARYPRWTDVRIVFWFDN